MAISYPSSVDTTADLPTDIVSGGAGVGTELDASTPPHSTLHNNISTAIVAIEETHYAPDLFLVNGSAYALTRAGVQAAVDAAEAVRGTVRLCGDVTSDGTPIDIDAAITFDFNNHVIKAPADATGMTGLVTVIGTISGTAHALASDAAIAARAVTVAAGGGASYTGGDYVFIDQPSSGGATKFFSQVCRVASVASDTLTLEDALKHNFTTAQAAQVRKWTPIEGVRIINVRADGNGNTGNPTRAIYLVDVRDCYVQGDFTSFATAAAVIADRGLRNRFDVSLRDCGDTGESDLMLYRQTAYLVDQSRSISASGFGIQSFGGCAGRMDFPSSMGAADRAIKLAHEGFTEIYGARADGALNSKTGLSLTLFSHDLRVFGGSGHGNDSYGLMIDACDRVKVFGWRGDTATVDDVDGACTEIELIDCAITTISDNHAAPTPLVQKGITRTWYERLPWDSIGTATRASDTHGSLGGFGSHLDMADGANHTIAFLPVSVPMDFVGSLELELFVSSAAGTGDHMIDVDVRRLTLNGSGQGTTYNPGVAAVPNHATANTLHLLSFPVTVQPEADGTRMLVTTVVFSLANGLDTVNDQRTLWMARYKFTKRDF